MFSWIQQLRRAALRKQEDEASRTRRREDERGEVLSFCHDVIVPALEDLRRELEGLGRAVAVHQDAARFELTVWFNRRIEFDYSIEACRRPRRGRRYERAYPGSPTYGAGSSKVYALREIRRTDRHRFASQLVGEYQRALAR